MFRFPLHTVNPRLAEKNRYVDTPLPVVPSLYAPGASVPPLRLLDFRRVCRACNQSRHPFLLQSLRLHSVTQAPSAGPAPTSEVRCWLHLQSTIRARAGKIAISRPDHHTILLLPRLSACLLTLRKTERTMLSHCPFRLPPSRAMGWTHAPSLVHSGTFSHAGNDEKKYIHIKSCSSFSVYRQSKVSQGYKLHFFSLCFQSIYIAALWQYAMSYLCV